MPVRSRAKKQRVVIQCVTRTRAECLGASFVTGAVETQLGTEASAGSCADPNVAIFGLRVPRTCLDRIAAILHPYRDYDESSPGAKSAHGNQLPGSSVNDVRGST